MKLETIVQDYPVYFGDIFPSYKEIMLEATDQICIHEGDAIADFNINEYFKIIEGANEDFGGAFITTPKGAYILHDLKETTSDDEVETTVFFTLSKVSDK